MYRRVINRVAIGATFLASVVVMLGAWTRLVDAGLGCPDWPGCYGFLTVPETPEKIAIAEMRFPDAPVEVDKGWPEMIHRYFASLLGFVLLCLSVYAISVRAKISGTAKEEALPYGHIFGLLALVICQGMFGMWTVTLKLWPQVVSAHLLGGFATLSLLFLLVLRTRRERGDSDTELKKKGTSVGKKAALIGLILVVIQIFLGAWTASNYAALACGDELPTCQGSFWPDMDFGKGFDLTQEVGPNYLGGTMDNESRVAIQVTHRVGAIVLSVYLIWMVFVLWRQNHASSIRNALLLMSAVLVVQFGLGLSNVILLVPLAIAVAHNAVGALLLLSMMNLNYQIYRLQK